MSFTEIFSISATSLSYVALLTLHTSRNFVQSIFNFKALQTEIGV